MRILRFTADWCGPCKVFGPRFDHYVSKNAPDADYEVVDVDKHPQVAAHYEIRSIPSVVVDGRVVLTGNASSEEIQKALT